MHGLFYLLPALRVEISSMVLAAVLAFFFLGTIRPIFFDTVMMRRGRRQPNEQSKPGAPPGDTGQTPASPVAGNTGEQSLTGQHRTSGRWL